MDERADEILTFWFAGDAKAQGARWFGGDPSLDVEIRTRFGELVETALRGELDPWEGSARGKLALVVLLDQMTRNLGRGTASAFAGDARALVLSERLRASSEDRTLSFAERYVALLPTMHAEDQAVQHRGLEAYRALLADVIAAGEPADQIRSAVDYAERHLRIIERFGRFPHRNAILGRASTDEELAFLKEPGSSF